MAFPLSYQENDNARPLHVVPLVGFDAWLSSQSETVRRWIDGSGFGATVGQCCLLPHADSEAGAEWAEAADKARALEAALAAAAR